MELLDGEIVCKTLDDYLEHYGDLVYRVALQNMKNIADAEDISQDVFIKIMNKRPEFETVTHEKAWILRVTMNMCKDRWRYNKVRFTTQLDENSGIVEPALEGFELLPEVMKLSTKYRNVIYLFYYEEFSVIEIAEILHKKEATILTWLHRARKQLRKNLEGGMFSEKEI